MSQLKVITAKDLRRLIDIYPDDANFFLLTLDFDKEDKISNTGELVNKDIVGGIAQKSQTIIYSDSQQLTHVDMHSIKQPDIYKIRPEGIMRTLLLDTVKR